LKRPTTKWDENYRLLPGMKEIPYSTAHWQKKVESSVTYRDQQGQGSGKLHKEA